MDYVTADISPMDGFPSELKLKEATIAFEALGNDAKQLLIEEWVLFNEPTPFQNFLHAKGENMPLLRDFPLFRSPYARIRTCGHLIDELRPSWDCFAPVWNQAKTSSNTNHLGKALLQFRYVGSGASNAVALLIASLQSTNQNLHIPSLAALYFQGTNAEPALPVLLAKLDSPDWQSLSQPGSLANPVCILGNIGAPAKAAVPRLEQILDNHSEEERRIDAALSLVRMEAHHDQAVSVLADSLTNLIDQPHRPAGLIEHGQGLLVGPLYRPPPSNGPTHRWLFKGRRTCLE